MRGTTSYLYPASIEVKLEKKLDNWHIMEKGRFQLWMPKIAKDFFQVLISGRPKMHKTTCICLLFPTIFNIDLIFLQNKNLSYFPQFLNFYRARAAIAADAAAYSNSS